jgi:deoxyribonuclease-4
MSLIGVHVSVAGGLHRAFERGEALDCEAIQIFTKNQLQWRAAPLGMGKEMRFIEAWGKSSIRKVVAHAAYLINLAAPEEDLRRRSREALKDELFRCDALGIQDLVLHPGSHRESGEARGLERIVEGLEEGLEETRGTGVRILLETMPGQGSVLGYKLEHFSDILEELQWHSRVGLCLDTCHLFAAGYDITSFRGYSSFVRSLDKKIGVERVWCWHCNDSKELLGSGKDRHAHLGEGEMGLGIFGHILNDPLWEDVPCILETPKTPPGDAANMALLRKSRG